MAPASASSSMVPSSAVEAPPLRRFDLVLTLCMPAAPLLMPARHSERILSASSLIANWPSTAAASTDLRPAGLVPAAQLLWLRTAALGCCYWTPGRAAPVGEVAWPPLRCAGPARPQLGPSRIPSSWRLQAWNLLQRVSPTTLMDDDMMHRLFMSIWHHANPNGIRLWRTSQFAEPDLLGSRQCRVREVVEAKSGRQVQGEPADHERQKLQDYLLNKIEQ